MTAYVIGILGTHSTGKTTLAKVLKQFLEGRGYSVYMIAEPARKFKREDLGKYETQKAIIKTIINGIRENINKYDIIITDRTPLDSFAYTLYYMIDRDWDPDLVDDILDEYINIMKFVNEYYDVLIYANNRDKLPLVDDGFRWTDKRSRNFVDVLVRILLTGYKRHLIVWDIDMSQTGLLRFLMESISFKVSKELMK